MSESTLTASGKQTVANPEPRARYNVHIIEGERRMFDRVGEYVDPDAAVDVLNAQAARIAELEAENEFQADWNADLLLRFNELEAAHRWIPVSETPEPGRYNVWMGSEEHPHYLWEAMFHSTGRWYCHEGEIQPTHYQPLPAPPSPEAINITNGERSEDYVGRMRDEAYGDDEPLPAPSEDK